MKGQKVPKFIISSFVTHSRLIKQLPTSIYILQSSQYCDIIVPSSKWSVFLLTMQYFIKAPRYIVQKLTQLKQKHPQIDINKVMIIVIIENNTEAQRYREVQAICLEKGVKNIPCFGLDEARWLLDDLANCNS